MHVFDTLAVKGRVTVARHIDSQLNVSKQWTSQGWSSRVWACARANDSTIPRLIIYFRYFFQIFFLINYLRHSLAVKLASSLVADNQRHHVDRCEESAVEIHALRSTLADFSFRKLYWFIERKIIFNSFTFTLNAKKRRENATRFDICRND